MFSNSKLIAWGCGYYIGPAESCYDMMLALRATSFGHWSTHEVLERLLSFDGISTFSEGEGKMESLWWCPDVGASST